MIQLASERKRRHARGRRKRPASKPTPGPVLGAIDVGTNACRLLIAVPHEDNGATTPQVIDSYAASVRLGEGLGRNGSFTTRALNRTIEALKLCSVRLRRNGATHVKAIATEACRRAANADVLIARAEAEAGIRLVIVTPEEEARLAAEGCLSLIGETFEGALIFDIGGGSTELILVRTRGHGNSDDPIVAWTSAPVGVVQLAERHGGERLPASAYGLMRTDIDATFAKMRSELGPDIFDPTRYHLLGTSGTLTTLAGIKLGLRRYVRSRIDGQWLTRGEVLDIADRIVREDFLGRAAIPCVGTDRADLLLPGCAILSAIMDYWPTEHLRVADRGLREGLLIGLLKEAGETGTPAGGNRLDAVERPPHIACQDRAGSR